jgi:regulator of PEP synthase PpsR (kinase-PPPase family)
MNSATILHLHLISDSTGETAASVARASVVQFSNLQAIEHHWPLVRSKSQMQKAIDSVAANPGVVIYTLVDGGLSQMLNEACVELNVPCIPIISRVVKEISAYLNIETSALPGRQYILDEEYFSRMEAINYSLAHDDGQHADHLDQADIVLVGPSRTSKTPTCIYLSYRGYKAANVPFVPGIDLPSSLFDLKRTFVVGLTINPETLVQIRKNRLLSLHEHDETDYVDIEQVKEEMLSARKLFTRQRWPVIDVTRRSVEETAATILKLYHEYKEKGYGAATA